MALAAFSAPTFPAPSSRPVAAPTRLRLPDLLHTTDHFANGVLDGRFDHLLPAGGLPADTRWYRRLHADDDLDVWLISWAPGHATELHDHGGSIGALTVLSGSLHEYRWDGERLRQRLLESGDQAAFPLGWVHDVSSAGSVSSSGRASLETLSVHAYSPPLTTMSYYEVTPRQALRRVRSEITATPEAS